MLTIVIAVILQRFSNLPKGAESSLPYREKKVGGM